MQWTDEQNAALDAVAAWFEGPEQVFRLFGYAGTGKTTLAKECAARIPGDVLFGAFTGKAALVLRQKGCHSAETIHRLIYTPKGKSSITLEQMREEYKTELRREVPKDEQKIQDQKCRQLAAKITQEEKRLKQPAFDVNPETEVPQAALVIIDEVSMVGTRMAEDLLKLAKKVLVLGDPAQLPPVGDGGYFTEGKPDIMLREIHRQAAGSAVIQLATQVRRGESIELGSYDDGCEVAAKGSFDIEAIAAFDQIIVGRNRTRHIINRRIRDEVLDRTSKLPEVGDRLVCLRNNHDNGLLNGSLWDVLEVQTLADEPETFLTLKGDQDQVVETLAHKAIFLGLDIAHYDRRKADEFDFGYALTCHKAQGSQWGSVFIVDESRAFNQNAQRWLYTAITRAADRVVIVR